MPALPKKQVSWPPSSSSTSTHPSTQTSTTNPLNIKIHVYDSTAPPSTSSYPPPSQPSPPTFTGQMHGLPLGSTIPSLPSGLSMPNNMPSVAATPTLPPNLMNIMFQSENSASAEVQRIQGLDFLNASKMFIDQASRAKKTANNTWGPGGRGGIDGQKEMGDGHRRMHDEAKGFSASKSRLFDGFEEADGGSGRLGVMLDEEKTKMKAHSSTVAGQGKGKTKSDALYLYAGGDNNDEMMYTLPSSSSSTKSSSSSLKTINNGKPYGLLDLATQSGYSLLGSNNSGRGISMPERLMLEQRYNKEDATKKWVFASQVLEGSSLIRGKRKKFMERREIAREKRDDAYDAADDDNDDNEMIDKAKEKVADLPGNAATKRPTFEERRIEMMKNNGIVADVKTATKSAVKGDIYGDLKAKFNEDHDDHGDSEEDEDEEEEKEKGGGDYARSGKVEPPPSRRKPRDASARKERGERRRLKLQEFRKHKINEMEPQSVHQIREEIMKSKTEEKREEIETRKTVDAKNTLLQALKSATASVGEKSVKGTTNILNKLLSLGGGGAKGKASTIQQQDPRTASPRNLPPPPPSSSSSSFSSSKALKHQLQSMKKHKMLVAAVEETLDSDVRLSRTRSSPSSNTSSPRPSESGSFDFNFNSNSANPSDLEEKVPSWAQPPSRPLVYDGVKDKLDPTDTKNLVEWRSETRVGDLRRLHNESMKVMHVGTLVDVLDTMGDLREDIESLKKERRLVIKASSTTLLSDDNDDHEFSASKHKIDRTLKDLENRIREMEGMLSKLSESRKKLMHQQPTQTITSDNSDVGGSSRLDEILDDEPVGGLDGLRERRRRRGSKNADTGNTSPRAIQTPNSQTQSTNQHELDQLWHNTQAFTTAKGASALTTTESGLPLYHKLLLDITFPRDVTSQQRQVYDFLKQSSTKEQIDFIVFALTPLNAKDLLAISSAFLKIHAHSAKSIRRFTDNPAYQNHELLQLLCCAAEDFHVEHLAPVLALLWLLAKIPSNKAVMLKFGVVGTCVRRMKLYANLQRRKGEVKKGVGLNTGVEEQSLCALSMLAELCF